MMSLLTSMIRSSGPVISGGRGTPVHEKGHGADRQKFSIKEPESRFVFVPPPGLNFVESLLPRESPLFVILNVTIRYGILNVTIMLGMEAGVDCYKGNNLVP